MSYRSHDGDDAEDDSTPEIDVATFANGTGSMHDDHLTGNHNDKHLTGDYRDDTSSTAWRR